MSLDFQRYLVDTNALFQLPLSLRTTDRIREVARFPSEVVHEAGDYAARYNLGPLEYKTTPAVLRHLKTVMELVPVDDHELIDLYAGDGCADPLLVACALDAASRRSGELVGEVFTVVTADNPVRRACERHEVEWISASSLQHRLGADVGSGHYL